ncbi:hypothetical protein DBT_0868 [Dissulfuribacter thermophilus]|uniref:HTH merR-type domain-containing protein n=1 Tax=Dissulfuribacter thermophilus TaxID=1156395 RepID=A0A1B9F7T4_9BACT|nr:MerR family transcriptional regulator [Dissulfuribacter thermophilus]OCC15943.1 hypothetical protein DBT_0868 [Dissulfuribacter thermophilus]
MGYSLRLSEVLEIMEIDLKTICALEKQGLIQPERDEFGERLFSDEDVGRLSLILSLKNDWGYSVSALKRMFSRSAGAQMRYSFGYEKK